MTRPYAHKWESNPVSCSNLLSDRQDTMEPQSSAGRCEEEGPRLISVFTAIHYSTSGKWTETHDYDVRVIRGQAVLSITWNQAILLYEDIQCHP
jgi:hypothetical protein